MLQIWLPRLPHPIRPMRMRSFAPITRLALRAVMVPAANRANSRRVLSVAMVFTPSLVLSKDRGSFVPLYLQAFAACDDLVGQTIVCCGLPTAALMQIG